jgi:phage shock protein A
MSSLSEKSAFEAFARMEERIENSERQLKASMEIDQEFSGDRLASEFKALEKGASSMSADMQLLALKQKLGMLPAGSAPAGQQLGAGGAGAARQLGAGRGAQPSADHQDEVAELEELPDQTEEHPMPGEPRRR